MINDSETPTHPLSSRSLDGGEEHHFLALAADPTTDPGVLAGIAHQCRDAVVRAALARNPSTPRRELLRLWKHDPAAIIENPIVILWEFTKSGSTKDNLTRDLQFVLYQHLLSLETYEPRPHLIDNEWIAWHLNRADKKVPFRLPLHLLVKDDSYVIRKTLLRNCVKEVGKRLGAPVGFPHAALRTLSVDSRIEIREALALAITDGWLVPDPLDMEFLSSLARTLISNSIGNLSIRNHIAKWPCLDSLVIERLAMNAGDELLAVLAAHPNASARFQERMAGHPTPEVRAGVASTTPHAHLIEKLLRDPSSIVRAGLASSPHPTPEMQRAIFEKLDSRIIAAFLRNPSTLPEILEAIARFPNLATARLLRKHPNTPPHVLERIPPESDLLERKFPPQDSSHLTPYISCP